MRKILLFTLALIGTMSAWGAYGTGDCLKYIESDADVTSKLGVKGSSVNTTDKHMTILVNLSGGNKVTIDGYTISNNNSTTEDGKTNPKNWSVIGAQGSGELVLKNCTIQNPYKGAGVQSYAGATITLENCYIEVSGYRGSASCAVQMQGGGRVHVISGTYISNAGASVLTCSSGGFVTIDGGTFTGANTAEPKGNSNYYGALNIYANESGKSASVTINGGTFNGYVYICSGTSLSTITGTINQGVFSDDKIYTGASTVASTKVSNYTSAKTYTADGMTFVDYKTYTGSSIDDVTPYADFATAYSATTDNSTINLLTTAEISSNTTIENRTIVEKGNADAFEVTDGTLTVQGTTTITANGEYNAVGVNGANAKLIVPENQDNVTIGKMTETSGEITLYAGTYDQDITAFLPKGYEQDPTTGKVKKSASAPTKHERTVTEGNWGTMCLAYATSSYTGAKFYRVVGKSDDQLQLTVELVEGQLAAGKPYIFCAMANKIVCNYTGDATTTAGSDNGLIGTIDGINWSGDDAEDDNYTGLNGMYMLSSNEFVLAGDGSALRPNRAYLNLDQVYNENSSAPGRRITLNIAGTNTTTNIDAISAESAQAQKVMLNGKLFIRRGAQLFDAQGALVK